MTILNNKYGIYYTVLIEKANKQNRSKKLDYYESHHIIPKSLGGSNDHNNLVLLTPREHYIAHLLLIRCVSKSNVYKMIAALARFKKIAKSKNMDSMCQQTNYTS